MHTLEGCNHLFQRRKDLNIKARIKIAFIALYFSKWGTITHLANKYNISRQLIYNLRDELSLYVENYFGKNEEHSLSKSSKKASSESLALILRLEGKCSIESASSVMERLGLPYSSVGFISQALTRIGKIVGNNLEKISSETLLQFAFCSDEIFSNRTPILITVCPISMIIFRIETSENRKGDTWEKHMEELRLQGYTPIVIAKDEGLGMKCGQAIVYPDVPCQSDTFHAVAHRLGLWLHRLEKAAYSAIEEEYHSLELLDKSKSYKTLDKRCIKYTTTQKKSHSACVLYDSFEFLYHCLLDCFQIFDSNGKLKNQAQTIADFDCALEFIESLNLTKINDEIKSINNCKKDLFYFVQIAEKVIGELSQTIDNKVLELLSLAYQTQKNGIKLKGNSERKKALKRKEQHILHQVKTLLGTNYEAVKNEVYAKLDQIIQSSAAVECINSILRPYLNTCKNKPSQEFLNLFMFYHNHRRFRAGKRKGKTPIELFSGEPQPEDWLELLLKKVAA